MPRQPTPKIRAWSYSRWTTYEPTVGGCPRKAKYKFLDKLPEPEGPALARGKEIHDLCELYVRGQVDETPIPEPLECFEEEFLELRENADDVLTEDQWAFWRSADGALHPCDWFDKRTWLRIKVDAAELLDGGRVRVIDYKTGKIREGYERQLELYALGAFNWFEGVEEVTAALWFLDHGVEKELEFTADDVDQLTETWFRRSTAMLNDRTFATNPGPACRYCPFSGKRGGPCEF